MIAEWLHHVATDLPVRARELAASPVGFPIVLAAALQSYRLARVRKLVPHEYPRRLSALLTIVVAGVLSVYAWNVGMPVFLQGQQELLTYRLEHFPPEVAKLAAGWHMEDKLLTATAGAVAFGLFFPLMISQQRAWYKDVAMLAGMMLVLTVLAISIRFVLVSYGLPMMVPSGDELAQLEANPAALIAAFRRGVEWELQTPIIAGSTAMCVFVVGAYLYEVARRNWEHVDQRIVILNVIVPCILLTASVIAFRLLPVLATAAWMFFVATGYPLMLGLAAVGVAAPGNLLESYARGVAELRDVIVPREVPKESPNYATS